LFVVVLEGFRWNTFQFVGYALLDIIQSTKIYFLNFRSPNSAFEIPYFHLKRCSECCNLSRKHPIFT
jgi:hypothetical protein